MHSMDSASSGILCASFGPKVYIGNKVKCLKEGSPRSVD